MPSYFCHQCNRNVGLRGTDLRCEQCNGEFIEVFGSEDAANQAIDATSVRTWINQLLLPHQPEADARPRAGGDSFTEVMNNILMSLESGGGTVDVVIGHGTAGNNRLHINFAEMMGFSRANNQQGLSERDMREFLPMTEVTQKHVDDGAQCPTCFDNFKFGEPVARLACDHIFHRPCIEPWLLQRTSCPVCRQPVELHTFRQQARNNGVAPPNPLGSAANVPRAGQARPQAAARSEPLPWLEMDELD